MHKVPAATAQYVIGQSASVFKAEAALHGWVPGCDQLRHSCLDPRQCQTFHCLFDLGRLSVTLVAKLEHLMQDLATHELCAMLLSYSLSSCPAEAFEISC